MNLLGPLLQEDSALRRIYRRVYWAAVEPLRQRILLRFSMWRYPGAVRLIDTVRPYTMVGLPRLMNALALAHRVESEAITGAIVECGVYKGGCIGLMAKASSNSGSTRKIWLFDSFEGLPEPTAEDGLKAFEYAHRRAGGQLASIDRCFGPLQEVEELLFQRLRLPRERTIIRKGWFQETVPAAGEEIGAIALLRLDGDWYESTRVCLENLYDRVVRGGFVIIDDYGYWEGCRRATDEFIAKRGITVDLCGIDDSGVYFRKA
jgi:O-methyltransferase